MASTLHHVLDRIRQSTQGYDERTKGNRFEILCKRFLETEPVYHERFSRVWLWDDWPYRGNIQDQGIDLVAQEAASGNYCAIQCKFYDLHHTMDLPDLSTFFTTATSTWQTDQGEAPFESVIIIATTDKWNDKVVTTIENHQLNCSYLGLTDLAEATVDWERLERGDQNALPPNTTPAPTRKKP